MAHPNKKDPVGSAAHRVKSLTIVASYDEPAKKLGISFGDSAHPKAGNDRLHILLVLYEVNQPQVAS